MSNAMQESHPMMPATTHDEHAEQLFVLELKRYLAEELDPIEKRLAETVGKKYEGELDERAKRVRNKLHDFDSYRSWLSFRRTAQEILWDAVRGSVERQAEQLDRLGQIDNPKGSLTLDPDFQAPRYLEAADTHMMPGGYSADPGEGSVLQGAMMDRGGAVFMLGRTGGLMNDGRGQGAMSHTLERFPTLDPQRVLDMGCGVGASTVPAAQCYPDAEIHGIDVGASQLRYAHARAEHLGATIHFSQQSAEHTNFPDGHFDLVYSCALFHETSRAALPRIVQESYRLLQPGGVAVHLEVPLRYEALDLWGHLLCDYETRYNNEPFWTGALRADFAGELERAGFRNIACGYQDATPRARPGTKGFGDECKGLFRSWYVASGEK
jgi:SAM-dependent methyltransferase